MILTPQQQDIYFDQLLFRDSPAYNIGAKIEIHGILDKMALQAAYQSLISQHPTFHSYITEKDGLPFMAILENYSADLEIKDFSQLPNPQQSADEFIDKEFKRPFDLSNQSFLHRVCLICLEETWYYLFSVYHHLITDGWGTSLMYRRLTELYNDVLTDGEVKHFYTHHYEEFGVYNTEYLKSDRYQVDATYWRNKYTVLPESLFTKKSNVANDFEPPKSERKNFHIERKVYNELIDLSISLNCSVFHIILGVIGTLMGRYFDCEDFSVGLPVLNRTNKHYKNTVGLFMNISPLKVGINFDSSFKDFIKQIKERLKQDYRHQEYPIGDLVRELKIINERHRLFNLTLSYEKQNYSCHFQNTNTDVIPLTHGAERVALAIYIREFDSSKDVTINFDYNIEFFNADDIDSLLCCFENLLITALENPECKLTDMPLLNADQHIKITRRFNDAKKAVAPYLTIIDWLDWSFNRFAKKNAISDEKEQFTYQEAELQVHAIAEILMSESVISADNPVGVIMDRSARMLITLLAILRTGSPFLPLDPSFPVDRLKYIVEQSQCKLIISDPSYASCFDDVHVISSQYLIDLSKIHVNKGKKVRVTAENLAYIIYTSGSTGKPKGVELTHRSLLNFLTSMQSRPGIDENDKLLAITTYSFDISILELFLPLISGAMVHIADRKTINDPYALIDTIDQLQPTIMQGTPSFWHMLCMAGWTGNKNLKILCGGEQLNLITGKKLIDFSKELWNMYGPTETTIWSAIKQIKTTEDISIIGKPINNTTLYILDKKFRPLPIGAIGEIFIGGSGLAKGYRFRPDLTGERFLLGLISPDQMLYRTGDIGKWNKDGCIEFIGRKDSQVKIRGYRIELSEIEFNLLRIPVINEAVVIVNGNGPDQQLIAFVVAKGVLKKEEVINSLRLSLPDYMIPSFFVLRDKIPLTPNGKTDRNALKLEQIKNLPSIIPASKNNTIEERLLKLWQQVFGLEAIDINDNFFDLGGRSLTSVQLLNNIYDEFGVRLKLLDIFTNPQIKHLAKAIRNENKIKRDRIRQAPKALAYPLSAGQKGIFALSQLSAASVAYNMVGVYTVNGNLSIDALNVAISRVINRHESLRTIFPNVRDSTRQKIIPIDEMRFSIMEHFLDNDNEESINTLIEQFTEFKFNFQTGPLLQCNLIKTLTNRQIIIFAVHHLVADGWSLTIFLNEVAEFYDEYFLAAKKQQIPLPIQYKDYAVWLNDQISTGALDKQKQYWLGQFSDDKDLSVFGHDKYTHNQATFNGNMISFVIDEDMYAKLKAIAFQNDATLFMVLITSIKILLFKQTGSSDICIGTPVSGRDHVILNDQIGLYINTVSLRSTLFSNDTFNGTLSNVKINVGNALDNQLYPYNELISELKRIGYRNKERLFDVMVVLQNPDLKLQRITLSNEVNLIVRESTRHVSRFPLTFNFHEGDNTISCNVEFNTDLFSLTKISAFIRDFQKLIGLVVANPSKLIGDYDLSPDSNSRIQTELFDVNFNFGD